jgi:hypothetical protein
VRIEGSAGAPAGAPEVVETTVSGDWLQAKRHSPSKAQAQTPPPWFGEMQFASNPEYEAIERAYDARHALAGRSVTEIRQILVGYCTRLDECVAERHRQYNDELHATFARTKMPGGGGIRGIRGIPHARSVRFGAGRIGGGRAFAMTHSAKCGTFPPLPTTVRGERRQMPSLSDLTSLELPQHIVDSYRSDIDRRVLW